MGVISFQKIFGLCGLKCHIVEIWRDVTFEDRGRTDNGNVNIELESAKQDSQYHHHQWIYHLKSKVDFDFAPPLINTHLIFVTNAMANVSVKTFSEGNFFTVNIMDNFTHNV